MAYFPMFVDLADKNCLVVGGGKVAARKVKMLLDFGAFVSVMAERICDELIVISNADSKLTLFNRDFSEEAVVGQFLVIAATDDDRTNRHIAGICRKKNIHINVVDKLEECSFILPSYTKEQNVVAAFSSGGRSPVLTQYLNSKAKEYVTEEIGSINECLGKVRKKVQDIFDTETLRKNVFREILEYSLHEQRILTEKEIENIISRMKEEYGIQSWKPRFKTGS